MEIPPPPRKVKKYYINKTLGRKMPITYVMSRLIFLPIVFAIIAIAVFYFNTKHHVDSVTIINDGVSTKATIVDFWVDDSRSKDDINPVSIQYSYENAGSAITNTIKTYAISDTTQLNKGDEIRVKYLGTQSTTIDYEEHQTSGIYNLFLVPVFFLIILLPFKLYSNSQYSEYKNLLENGLLVVGKVKPIGKSSTILPNSNITTKIVYTYEHNGSMKTDEAFVGKDDFIIFKSGEEIDILALGKGLSCIVTK